jgi:hypothetical protein
MNEDWKDEIVSYTNEMGDDFDMRNAVWPKETPAWAVALKVLGVIAGAVGMTVVLWLFTVLMFLI